MTIRWPIVMVYHFISGHNNQHQQVSEDHHNGVTSLQNSQQTIRGFPRASIHDSFGLPINYKLEGLEGQSWILDGGKKLLAALTKRERSKVRLKRTISQSASGDVVPKIENILFVVSFTVTLFYVLFPRNTE